MNTKPNLLLNRLRLNHSRKEDSSHEALGSSPQSIRTTVFRINKRVRKGPFCATLGLLQKDRTTASRIDFYLQLNGIRTFK